MNSLLHPGVAFCYAGLFSSAVPWKHPERVEDTHELIYVTQGEVYMNDGGREICAVKGEMMVLEAGVRHFGYKESTDVSFYWVHFDTGTEALPFETRFLSHFDSSHLFKEMLHYYFLPTPAEELVNATLVRILAEIKYLSQSPQIISDKTAEEIYEWLRVNASAELTAAKAAKHFGFSSDHIARILKKQDGHGTKALIDMFLLSRAKELLANTGLYVKEIAYELGFSNDKCLIGFFKYHEGVFPSEFRNRYFKIHMNRR